MLFVPASDACSFREVRKLPVTAHFERSAVQQRARQGSVRLSCFLHLYRMNIAQQPACPGHYRQTAYSSTAVLCYCVL